MSGSIVLDQMERAAVIEILRRHLPRGAQVHVFGSRATGRCKPMSDLDLAIDAGAPLPLAVLAALAEDFAESDLPWKVDIVDRALITETFGRIIDATKVPLSNCKAP